MRAASLFRRTATRVALVIAFAGAAASPGVARAQGQTAGVEEGRTRFNRGIDLYKEGNFHAALAEFRAAYAAAPSYRIHYNLGQTLYQLQDYAGAVRAFEQYLSEGGDKIEADRRKEVDSDLAKLRPRVAKLSLNVNVPNAEVTIDDEPHGKVTKSPVLVSAGRRRISVTASGYQTETRVLDVAGTQQLDLAFELKPVGGGAVKPDDKTGGTDSPLMRSKSRTSFYVGLTTTLVLGAGTAVMAVVTAKNHSDYEKALELPNNASAIDDAKSSTKTTAIVADILGGATAVSAGLTILAYVLTSGNEPVPAAKVDPPKPTWRPALGPTAVGVVGTF